jgi:hypothetical protein
VHIHRGILTQPGQKQYGSLYNNCCKQLQAEGLALTLFVFWILTDNADASLSLNDLALIANGFNRRSDFHVNPPFMVLMNSYGCAFVGRYYSQPSTPHFSKDYSE